MEKGPFKEYTKSSQHQNEMIDLRYFPTPMSADRYFRELAEIRTEDASAVILSYRNIVLRHYRRDIDMPDDARLEIDNDIYSGGV